MDAERVRQKVAFPESAAPKLSARQGAGRIPRRPRGGRAPAGVFLRRVRDQNARAAQRAHARPLHLHQELPRRGADARAGGRHLCPAERGEGNTRSVPFAARGRTPRTARGRHMPEVRGDARAEDGAERAECRWAVLRLLGVSEVPIHEGFPAVNRCHPGKIVEEFCRSGGPGGQHVNKGRDGRHAPPHPNGDHGACQPIAVSSQESSRSCAVAGGQARSRSGRGAPIAARRSREEPQGQALAGHQTPSGRIKAQARRDEATAQKDRLKDFGESARRNALFASRRASMGSLGFTRRELCAPPSARESKSSMRRKLRELHARAFRSEITRHFSPSGLSPNTPSPRLR